MTLNARSLSELLMRNSSSKSTAVVKVDRRGYTLAEKSRKINEAAQIATKLNKPGKTKSSPLPSPMRVR